MHKALIGLAVAATLGLATVAAPSAANAQRCFGCAVGVGVLGGVVAGAIVGSAIANNPPPPAYGYPPPPPPPGYPPPAAYGPPPGYGPPPAQYAQLAPGCYWSKPHKVWVEGYGYQWRRHPICP